MAGQEAAAPPPSAVQEVGDVHSERVGNEQQMAQFHLAAGLHPLHGRPVDAGLVSECLLGHVLVQPPYADAVAYRPTGVEDPLRLIGWHPTNVLAIMIISQQQI
ncbi:hypothetical protein [Streptomyces flaveolus]|uniref:hypothetical protein n=1 Tax=Streptomyces flaveolus TaxID=67297 RepID=UPI003F53EACC